MSHRELQRETRALRERNGLRDGATEGLLMDLKESAPLEIIGWISY